MNAAFRVQSSGVQGLKGPAPPLSNFRFPLSAFHFPRRSAFTLVEIVVSLTIMALILGAAVPSIRGIIREQQALEPLTELADMVRTTRDRAIRLQRPYQLGFDADGCFAAAFFPSYGKPLAFQDLKTEADALRQEAEVAAASAARYGGETPGETATGAAAATRPDDRDFLLRYEWPAGCRISLRFWQDPEWESLDGAQTRLWVIQPTGLSLPVRVRLEGDGVAAEARFDPLTGEMAELRSSVR